MKKKKTEQKYNYVTVILKATLFVFVRGHMRQNKLIGTWKLKNENASGKIFLQYFPSMRAWTNSICNISSRPLE